MKIEVKFELESVAELHDLTTTLNRTVVETAKAIGKTKPVKSKPAVEEEDLFTEEEGAGEGEEELFDVEEDAGPEAEEEFIEDEEVPAPAKATKAKPAATKAAVKASAKPAAKAAPAATKAAAGSKITKTEIISLFNAFSKKNGKEKAIALLKKLGAKSVHEIDPKHYAKIVPVLKK